MFKVYLPENSKLDFRSLSGIGKLVKGDEPKEMNLTPEQVRSLKGKGVVVEAIVEATEDKPAAKPRKKGKESD